jgi:AbiTii-like protein
MALLQDIVAAATNEECDVPSLLRKVLVLASRLRNNELKNWAGYELNGYPEEDLVPEYRRSDVISYGFFADRFVGQATLQVPVTVLPKEFRDKYRRVVLQNPINALIDLLERSKGKGTEITFPWPAAARQYAQKVSQLQCISAWRAMNPSFIAGVVDTVKTRILLLSLDLEAADPTAGDVPSTQASLSEAKVSQIITTHIHGTVQNFSAGGDNVTQTATLTVQAGDKQSLLSALKAAGLQQDEMQELSEAIAADEAAPPTSGPPSMGERVKAWLDNLHVRAAQGLASVSTEVVAGVITAALLAYFGIPS